MGWLREGVASGRVPTPKEISPTLEASVDFRLGLQQIAQPAPLFGCKVLDQPVTRHLETGQSLGVRGGRLRLFDVGLDHPEGDLVEIDTYIGGETLVAVVGPIDVRIASDTGSPFQVCG
jgi:hypothetical protein